MGSVCPTPLSVNGSGQPGRVKLEERGHSPHVSVVTGCGWRGEVDFEGATPPAFPSFLHGPRIIDGTDDKEIVGHPPFSSCKWERAKR